MPKLKPNQFVLAGHIITETPILFQTEMVQANMEGRKTQTRRTKGLDYLNDPSTFNCFDSLEHVVSLDGKNRHGVMLNIKDSSRGIFVRYPYGKPGDLLWVRETWESVPVQVGGVYDDKPPIEEVVIRFKADSPDSFERWKPSIHMPKSASRIWAMIEDISVERVQAITAEDAISEGCSHYGPFGEFRGSLHPNGGSMKYRAYSKPEGAFQCIWETINGSESWKSNPHVWVIKYRILSKKGRPSDGEIFDNYWHITAKKAIGG